MALRVVTARPRQTLTATNANPQTKLKVTKNTGGMQGSNYNPQRTKPARQIQKTAPRSRVQGGNVSGKALQGGSATTVQRSVTIKQVQAAAERKRAAIKLQRQQQQRAKAQKEFNQKVSDSKSAFKLRATDARSAGKIGLATSQKLPEVKTPYQDEYRKMYVEAYKQAMSEYEEQRQPAKMNWFQKGWDKVSFGQNSRDSRAKEWAKNRAEIIAKENVQKFKQQLGGVPYKDGFLGEQARRRADIEKTKFDSQEAYDKAIKSYESWQTEEIGKLEKIRATTNAKVDGFSEFSETPPSDWSSSLVRKGGQWLERLENNPIYKFTLGSGTESVTSIENAPRRSINWIGNKLNPDREIHRHGNDVFKLSDSGMSAWEATQYQRNWNHPHYVDQEYDQNAAWRELSSGKPQVASYQNMILARRFNAAKSDDEKDQIAREYWSNMNKFERNSNTIGELGRDPWLMAGAARSVARQGTSFIGSKLSNTGVYRVALSARQTVSNMGRAVMDSKPIKWLGSEYKRPEERLGDAVDAAKAAQDGAQNKILKRINKINIQLSKNQKIDVSIFKDFEKLTDFEAKALQRMVGGKLSPTDRARLAGRHNAPAREKLESLARRWEDFTEQMKIADEVSHTRFGRNKRFYSPRTRWTDAADGGLEKYNFRLFQKSRGQQSADDMRRGAIDRYFKSDIDTKFGDIPNSSGLTPSGQRSALRNQRNELIDEYDASMQPHRDAVTFAAKKVRSPWNRSMRVLRKPNDIWRKSVLKYRPAWYVNNVLYNVPASVLAGGSGAIKEGAKLLRPKYWKKAMAETPHDVRTSMARAYGGTGKLDKFGNSLEDWSRVAAYRANKAKGMTHEQARLRVDKYLFDYGSKKNWERPFRSVMPFWTWHKNLARAGAQMPFDQPAAAIGLNRFGNYQDQQFDETFKDLIPKLQELGMSDGEIQDIKDQNEKYFKGRLRVGDNWYNTPFNAFSERGMDQFGINPWMSAGKEWAQGEDYWGRKTSGFDASLTGRLLDRFPQSGLAKQGLDSYQVEVGNNRPTRNWIGAPGSAGYGMTKEAQGYDPTKQNYQKNLDPRNRLSQNVMAYLGKPSSIEFDGDRIVEFQKLSKVTDEYFNTEWSNDFTEREQQQAELFKRFGMTPDDFYKGVLGKYDTDHSKGVKAMREDAREQNRTLFDEYGKQPKGTRGRWAMNKLQELNKEGYFDENPFLSSFNWLDPESISSIKSGQQKSADYQRAKATGNWSGYRSKYGLKQSAQSTVVREALRTGDWSKWRELYGQSRKGSKYQYDGKHFKSEDSMNRYKEGNFWKQYSEATPEDRKTMIADNPQYNRRGDWTSEDWDQWRADRKKTLIQNNEFSKVYSQFKKLHTESAQVPLTKSKWRRRTLPKPAQIRLS